MHMTSNNPVRRCQLLWSHRPQSIIAPTRLPQTLTVLTHMFQGELAIPFTSWRSPSIPTMESNVMTHAGTRAMVRSRKPI